MRKNGDTMKVLLKLKKAGAMFLAIVMFSISMPISVLASNTIEMNRLGSIAINTYSTDSGTGSPVSGIKFTIYKVAGITNTGDFYLTNDFWGSGIQLNKLTTNAEISAATKTLSSYASAKNISGSSEVTDSYGIVRFKNLTLGCYLIVPDINSINTNIYTIYDPLLISVPMKSSNGASWIYDITAYPKSDTVNGAVILEKINNLGTLLSGAVFRLEKKVYVTNTVSVPSGVQTSYDINGNYYWNTMISTLTTNSNGQIVLKNIPYGQYRFIETAAPVGYVLDSTPHEFTISASGSVILVNGKYIPNTGSVQTITVLNSYYYIPPYYPTPTPFPSPTPPPVPTNISGIPTATPTPKEKGIIDKHTPPGGKKTKKNKTPDGGKPGFDLPRTGGSICYAVCTYGGILLMICGIVVFAASRKKKV